MTDRNDLRATGPLPVKCECGHDRGYHKSNRTTFPHPRRYGVCLDPDCACREYRAAAASTDDTSEAA